MEIENGIFKNLQFLKSPNFNERPDQEEIRLIIIHSISLPPKIYGKTYVEDFFLNKLNIDEHNYFEQIKDLKVVHSAKLPYADDGFYATEKEERAMDIITSKEAKKEEIHPLVKIHPETNQKCLFVNPVYSSHVHGMDEEESFLLLLKLYDHMTQERFIYRHKWSENMLLMWDNRTVMHMADGGYDGYDRLLHRITIAN